MVLSVYIKLGCHTLKCPIQYLLDNGTLSVYQARLSFTEVPYIEYMLENSTVSVYRARLYTEIPHSVFTLKWYSQCISIYVVIHWSAYIQCLLENCTVMHWSALFTIDWTVVMSVYVRQGCHTLKWPIQYLLKCPILSICWKIVLSVSIEQGCRTLKFPIQYLL